MLRPDHAAFWQQGYTALMISDTAEFRNPNYHCRGGADDPATLDYDFARCVTQTTAQAVRNTLDM